MATILDLPCELLDDVLLKAVLIRGVKMGLRLRLVNKSWAGDVRRALFISRLLDVTPCDAPTFLGAYFVWQIFSDPKNTITPLRTIRRISEILCEGRHQPDNDASRQCVESLCLLMISKGRGLHYLNWYQGIEVHKDFEYHLLVAAAYMNHLYLLRDLLPKVGFRSDGSPFFGHPAEAAALQGNNEALELILKTEWKNTSTCAFRGAIANAHLDTLDLLLDPRWGFNNALNHRFTKCIWSGLTNTSSAEMFTRAFPLLGDFELLAPEKRLGTLLRYAATNGHTMLALYLFQLGARTPEHKDMTFEELDPLWAACKFADETLVRLLLRKGANPNVPHGFPQSSPLQIAARRGRFIIVQTLLDYGADLHNHSADIPQAIVSAIELEHMAIFRLLCQRGAAWTPRNTRVVFNRIAKLGLESMAKLLIQEGLVPTSDSIDIAHENRNLEVAEILCTALSEGKDNGFALWDVEWIN